MRRPLLAVASFFAIGIAVGTTRSVGGPGFFYCLPVGLWLAAVWAWQRRILVPFLLLLLMAAVGYSHAATAVWWGRTCLSPGRVQLQGIVVSPITKMDWGIRFDLRVPPDALVRVFAQEVKGLRHGQWVSLPATLERPAPAMNPGGFDYSHYLTARGIFLLARAEGPLQTGPVAWNYLPGHCTVWRETLLNKFQHVLGAESGGLLAGITLGERSAITDEMTVIFQDAGIGHLLAVSGLHVGIVAGAFFFALRWLCGTNRTAALASIPLVFFYVLLTGVQASALRAGLTASVVLCGRALRKEHDSVNLVSLAALLLLLINPLSLHQIGFQLSFAATYGILLLYPRLTNILPVCYGRLQLFWQALLVSLAAQLAVLPLLIWHFGRLCLLAPIVNVLLVPLLSPLMICGLGAAAVASVWPFGAQLPLTLCGYLLGAICRVAQWGAALPGSGWVVALGPLVRPFLLAYYPLLLLIFGLTPWPGRIVRRLVAGLVGCCLICGWVAMPPLEELAVTFLSVGCGDACAVRLPDRSWFLVDTGLGPTLHPEADSDAGAEDVLPFLRWQGARRLRAVWLTHPHDDHVGGLASVLQAMPVGAVICAPGGDVPDLQRVAEKHGVPCRTVSAGDVWEPVPGVKVEVWHPATTPGQAALDPQDAEWNEQSLVIRLVYGNTSLLFTGDAGFRSELAFLQRGRPAADVLKVGHHGSAGSSGAGFLQAVAPDWAVVSVGRNPHGLPAETAMQRLQAIVPVVLRTDDYGAITCRSDGYEIKVAGYHAQPVGQD
ncbi:MAG TPA: DNA internalization-related competence protein ComEC/Rec2 [Firmicutes bacterium]|jgi:competence protein ComEC|nr:DNA internalization-related competence protein ComEC/Rec2 [Bacillota bacterium]